MGDIVKFSAVNSKIKAIKGSMIKKDIYIELLRANGFYDVLKILNDKTWYGETLKKYDLNTIRRLDFEKILNHHFIQIFEKISHYFSGELKKIINGLYLSYEIEDLKVLIRGIYIGKSKEDIKKALVYKSKLNTIDFDYLLESPNLLDLTQRLKDTKYYKPLKRTVPKINDSLFNVEMELDFLYTSNLRKLSKKLDKENKIEVLKFLGLEADIANISWIYRGKFYYKIIPEELYNFTIYDGLKLKKEDIKKLCYTKTIDEFRGVLMNTPYKELYMEDDIPKIASKTRNYFRKELKKSVNENKYNIKTLLSFLALYKLEINDVITIAEEKRYKLNFEDSKKYVSVQL